MLVTAVILLMLVAGGIAVVVGVLRVISEASGEGLLWTLAVLFVPGGIVVFVLGHWALCWRGVKPALIGGAAFGFAWVFGLPQVHDSGDERRIRRWAQAITDARHPPVRCPQAEKSEQGFALYCCTYKGWEVGEVGGCTAVYAPTETCTEARVGQTARTVCGGVGPRLRKE